MPPARRRPVTRTANVRANSQTSARVAASVAAVTVQSFGDVPQNVGNWQWVAGTGPDAAPYFRVFNPTLQSAKFDPEGAYLRRWVPELAPLDDRAIHEPSKLGPLELAAAGITLDADYPSPIVDHAAARRRAIDAYKAARTP